MLSDDYLGQISYLTSRNHNCGFSGVIKSGKDQYHSTGLKKSIPVMTMTDTKTLGKERDKKKSDRSE